MSTVVRLVQPTNQETIDLLRALLEKAEAGEIVGIAGCLRWRLGEERIMRTGPYKNRDCAVAMTARLNARLLEDMTRY